ncbi:MAG: hypothetical protein WEB89_11320, partial [Balneolales bacterium]
MHSYSTSAHPASVDACLSSLLIHPRICHSNVFGKSGGVYLSADTIQLYVTSQVHSIHTPACGAPAAR